MSASIEVNDSNFDSEVLQSDVPVLVDFWAEWCGPCKMIGPIVEEVAGEYAGRLKVAKVNVDNSSGSAAKYGVRGIPTLILFKNGSVADTKVGAVSKSQLQSFVDSAM
ncbi:MAG: thioredoxin TrxA [Gammaproteobacteria bacterium]|nr:thioredoxin TrxA [Gammaproteobacteria bacterium]